MNTIQVWVMQLCVACILVSVILTFVKNEKVNNSIKTVLALYILITAVAPLSTSLTMKEIIPTINPQSITVLDSEGVIKQNAENTLKTEINNYLAKNEISATCTKILLSQEMDFIENAEIVLQDAKDESQAQALLSSYLGKEIEIIFKQEG